MISLTIRLDDDEFRRLSIAANDEGIPLEEYVRGSARIRSRVKPTPLWIAEQVALGRTDAEIGAALDWPLNKVAPIRRALGLEPNRRYPGKVG